MKDILDKLDAIETPVAGVAAPTLPSPIQLDESAQLRVLAGQSSLLTEAKKVKEPKTEVKPKGKVKPVKKEKPVDEKQVESLDDDEIEEELEESAAHLAARAKFENLVTKVTPVSKVKDKSGKTGGASSKKEVGKGGGDEFKKHLNKELKTEAVGLVTDPAHDRAWHQGASDAKNGIKPEQSKAAPSNPEEKKAYMDGYNTYLRSPKKAGGLKTESRKKAVKESIEPKLTFKQMVSLVQESGGQQQIDAVDTELFAWAQRVASAKYEGIKQELYAGMVYENMGGEFRMYDVLSEAALTRPQMARQMDLANQGEQDQPVPDDVIADFDDNFYDAAWHNFDESEQFFDAIKAVGRAHVTNQNDANVVAQLVHIVQDLYGNAIDQYMQQNKGHYQKQAADDMIGDSFGESFDEEFEEAFGKHQAKQNWFETLNAALESEGLVDQWPTGRNISYGQTVRVTSNDGERLISVTRETDGRYERPVHYKLR